MTRYLDGKLRQVVSFRRISRGTGSTQIRVEQLTCGHEQTFDSHSIPKPNGWRICRQCPQWDGRHAGTVTP